MKAPDPLVIAWQGSQVRIRHDDPHLGPYTPRGAAIRSAMELASDVEGLQLFLVTALGDRYEVRVADDGTTVGLWRRRPTKDPREEARSWATNAASSSSRVVEQPSRRQGARRTLPGDARGSHCHDAADARRRLPLLRDHGHDHELLLSQGESDERPGSWSLAAEIDRLAALRDRGDLSAVEFAIAKERVLRTPSPQG